jgi:hypothetical protein
MVTNRGVAPARAFGSIFFLAFLFACTDPAIAQSTGKTVRHHKVEEQDPAAASLAEAETDIDKHDYASADSLAGAKILLLPTANR